MFILFDYSIFYIVVQSDKSDHIDSAPPPLNIPTEKTLLINIFHQKFKETSINKSL